ncbi:MAG: VCBS repeat-containing protein [Oligoflexia bacterium]|nr:VCBS repeat-containing protein [Oligoflexia bacterium]
MLLYGLGLTASCSDYNLFKPTDPGMSGLTDGGATTPSTGDTGYGPCGAPAVDIDVAVNEDCATDVEPGDLDTVVEWNIESFSSWSESDEVLMAPVVGQLTDDNGDHNIDRNDIPDIVVITDNADDNGIKHGILRVISGRDPDSVISIERPSDRDDQIFPYRYSNVALGDVDNDGQPEIVLIVNVIGAGTGTTGGGSTTDTAEPGGGDDTGNGGDNPIFPAPPGLIPDYSCYVAAFSVDGTLDWIADGAVIDCAGHAPALADLDADGWPEVIVGNLVINGEDGSTAWKGSGDSGRFYAYAEMGMISVVADLDGDGYQEVIAGRSIYSSTGEIECTAEADDDGFTAVADLDGDGQGEVVLVGNGQVTVYDTDCTILSSFALVGGGNGGPPALADVNQDGVPEIALASATDYAVYMLDGTQLWSNPVSDLSSHATGSIIFDFEHDGQPEIVYADEVALYIFDAQTGEIRSSDDRHSSRTLHEYPTVADIDLDGSAEILVPNGGGYYEEDRRGLYALGSASSNWQAGGTVWNQHAFSITNIDEDMHIPAHPDSNWPDHNNFRSGDPNPSAGAAWPDAVPVARVCTDECADGLIVVDIAMANQGAAGLRPGVPIHAWFQDDAGDTHSLDVSWTDTVTPQGTVSAATRLVLSAASVAGRTIYVAADQDAAGISYADECDEGNNTLMLTDTSCP